VAPASPAVSGGSGAIGAACVASRANAPIRPRIAIEKAKRPIVGLLSANARAMRLFRPHNRSALEQCSGEIGWNGGLRPFRFLAVHFFGYVIQRGVRVPSWTQNIPALLSSRPCYMRRLSVEAIKRQICFAVPKTRAN
jgi:hypothetical protein